jgi:hypothetical protein
MVSMKVNGVDVQVKRGLRFEHARFIDPNTPPADNVPQVYVVTRVAKGIVYYRPAAGGSPFYVVTESFWKVVKTVLSDKHFAADDQVKHEDGRVGTVVRRAGRCPDDVVEVVWGRTDPLPFLDDPFLDEAVPVNVKHLTLLEDNNR